MTLNLQKHQGKGTYFTIIQISVFFYPVYFFDSNMPQSDICR